MNWFFFTTTLFWLLVGDVTKTVAQSSTPKGSIDGVVQEEGSRSPIAGAHVYVLGAKSVTTDADGRYEIKDLTAGTYKVNVYSNGPIGPHGVKVVQLASGQDLKVDFLLKPKGSITGRVVDENGEPSPGAEVFLVAREYHLGSLRYVFAGRAHTDDRGQYQLTNIAAGPGYLIEVTKRNLGLNSISDAPADPKFRKKTVVPTWFPESDSIEAAQVLVLNPGEHREGVDFRLKKSMSYCIDGILGTSGGPGPLDFRIDEKVPTSGASGNGTMFVNTPSGKAGPDGRIRLCDLHTGVYRLTAFNFSNSDHPFFGEADVSIEDKDVHSVTVIGRPQISISGELVWNGKPPDQTTQVRIQMRPIARSPSKQEAALIGSLPSFSVPGRFTLSPMFSDDYSITVMGLSTGTYLKDIMFGGQSALHLPIHVGKTTDSDLRIVLAHDGAVMNTKVVDKDNKPVPDSTVVLLPESASTDAILADSVLQGQTDQLGSYNSDAIAPGKYYVLATNAIIDKTPECIAKLLRARAHAQEIELEPNGSITLTLSLVELN